MDNEDEEEEGEGGLEPTCPPNPYQMHPPPEGCCTMDGEAGSWQSLRLCAPGPLCPWSLATSPSCPRGAVGSLPLGTLCTARVYEWSGCLETQIFS